jgi:5-methylcytosine-specific restriction endonuclease McrA
MKQGGICPYTGKILSLGKDASVDHIVPKSRGGSTELSNLQWVYYQVNFMKGDMFHEEFLELIGLIKLRFKMEDF